MQFKAIFFDAAGTLFRLRDQVGHTYSRIGASHGLAASPDRLETAFRSAWKSLPSPVHPEAQSPPADDDRSWWRTLVNRTFDAALDGPPGAHVVTEELFNELYDFYGRAEAWQLFDDVHPTLAALQGRFRLLVVSNFDRRLHGILDGLEIAPRFERIIVSSEVGASKPHPRIFAAAIHACALPPAECLHVGDDPKCDDEGAKQAGLRSFLLHRPEVALPSLLKNLGPNQDYPLQSAPPCVPTPPLSRG